MGRCLLVSLRGLAVGGTRPAAYDVGAGSPGREVSPLNGVNAGASTSSACPEPPSLPWPMLSSVSTKTAAQAWH